MRLVSFFAAASLLALGCASRAGEDAATSTSNIETGNTTPAADAILVQQAQHLFSEKVGADGKVLETTIDDYSMMIGGKVLTAKHERASGSYECTFFPGDEVQKGDYRADALSLAEPNGASTILLPMMAKEEGDFELRQTASVTGNLGPYVFVRQDVGFFGCGAAHGGTTVSAFVWDAKNAQKIAFTPPPGALDKAHAALDGRGFDGEPTLAEVIPRFDAQGHFSLQWRFEKAASYAESDGLGSSYTISALVDAQDTGAPLPPELDALKDPPASIAAFLAQNPTAGQTNPILGWSRAE